MFRFSKRIMDYFEDYSRRISNTVIKELSGFTEINFDHSKINHSTYNLFIDSLCAEVIKRSKTNDVTFCMPDRFTKRKKIESFVKNLTDVVIVEDFELDREFDLERSIIAYMRRSYRLDIILSGFTKNFCAEYCPASPVGCCGDDFNTHKVPEIFLKLQEKEAKKNGWTPIENKYKCNYHDKGCYLRLFKSPVCLGFMCPLMKKHFSSLPDKKLYASFFEKMSSIQSAEGNDGFDKEILEHMYEAVLIGEFILNKEPEIYKQKEFV